MARRTHQLTETKIGALTEVGMYHDGAGSFTYRSDLMVLNLGSTGSGSMAARAIWGSAHSLMSVWSELGRKPPLRARWWLKKLTR